MRLIAAALIGVVSATQASFAEPSPTTTFLMKEPVSAFSYGLDKIDKHLEKAFSGTLVPITSVYYDWDLDRIILKINCFSNCGGYTANEIDCATMVEKVRNWGCVYNGKGRQDGTSCFSTNFRHGGYTTLNRPRDVEQTMDQKFVIRIHFSNASESKLYCEAPLIGTNYSIVK